MDRIPLSVGGDGSGPSLSKKPSFDLNIPSVEHQVYELMEEEIKRRKAKLADLLEPLIQREAARSDKAKEENEGNAPNFTNLKKFLTRARNNTEDETKGSMDIRDKAAIKAMLVNRVGDFGLAPGILGCFTLFQTVDFSTIFARASAPRNSWISCNMRLNAITLICILLFIGAVGKSAQIGSHTWSPDAMEGPTPVSALIHAATMVTASVFMIARCSPLLEYPPMALIVITFAGAMTSFLAATTGILQNDLKRVIAYSTCSQLGYMIFACGISNYSVSIFHLMNHAFFKALLFLSAGSEIHAMSDEQDMRKMGGLASSFPFTYAMMLMGSLSLIGFPFLTGFYSKDVILELAYTKYTISGNFAFWLGSVSVLFTSYYSFRSLFLTFLVPTNSFGRDILRCHDAPITMAIPLILLALRSLFIGYLAKV
ncbi:NADH-ubiquinone oxidoreductase chain 5 [Capsicum annuum]|uniref:NADH-ubiquinone oxidoreductase chain 5 n=1 Tax=Capsicum annuum TaxID=4072 RepID=A0A2G2YYW3_CAPAN|nr:NADH-ubiquinone oxidoreductase chain 5 [Capsicum annuum]